MNENTVELDVSKQPAVAPVLYIGQGDHNGTVLNVKMYDNGEPLDLTGMDVRFSMKAPNNLNYYTVNGTVDGNIATFTIDEEYAGGVPGKTEIAYVQVIDGDVTTSTNRMVVFVLPSADYNTEILPGYKSLIEQFLEESTERVDEAVAAAEAIVDYDVPVMSPTMRGGAKLGNGLDMTGEVLSVNIEDAGAIPAAEKGSAGGVAELDENGIILSSELPVMSASTKGGAKLGSGLSIEDDALNLGPLTNSGSGASVETDGSGIFGVTGEGWAEQDGTPSPDSPVEIEVARGRNLLNYDAPRKTGAMPNTTVRPLDGSGVWIGISRNNYFNQANITGLEIADGAFTFTALSGGYGIGCEVAVEPGATYYASGTCTNSYGAIGLGYYDSAGNLVSYSGTTALRGAYTVPSGCAYAILVLLFNSENQSGTFSNIQLELGSTPTPYVPYGHMGLEVQGRNLLAAVSATNTGGGVTKSYDRETGVFSASGTVTSQTDISLTLIEPIHVPTGEVLTFGMIDGVLEANGTFIVFVREKGAAYPEYHGIRTQDRFCNFTNIGGKVIDQILIRMNTSTGTVNINTHPTLELGSTAHDYEPYHHTTTPIPLPAKGFAGALPDGTADTLEVDSAGRVEWTNATAITTQAVTDGVSGTVGTDVMSSTGVIADGATVLYEPSTPTTEHGYIDLPDLPAGATVSILELEAIGVEWWVKGAEAIAEHGRDVSKANKEQEDRIAELEAAVANMG